MGNHNVYALQQGERSLKPLLRHPFQRPHENESPSRFPCGIDYNRRGIIIQLHGRDKGYIPLNFNAFHQKFRILPALIVKGDNDVGCHAGANRNKKGKENPDRQRCESGCGHAPEKN